MAASTMSDEDDRCLLASLKDDELIETILRIKRNDPSATQRLEVKMGGQDGGALRRMGQILGQAKRLRRLNLSGINQNVASLWEGLGLNRSIKFLDISDVELGDTRLSHLEPLLKHNRSLTHLVLHECNIDSAAIALLSQALLERSENTLVLINLNGNPLGDANLDRLVQVVKKNNVYSLSLQNTGIGKSGCDSLSGLLSDPNSKLTHLYLSGNLIDDKAVSVLVESLAGNAKLQTLDLSKNSAISKVGWSKLLDLVCNSSSIDGVMDSNEVINRVLNSNHTLSYLDLGLYFCDGTGTQLGVDDANLLFASLQVNGQRRRGLLLASPPIAAVRHKIIWRHAWGDLNIGESSIVDDVRILPHVLAWFSVDQSGTVRYRDLPFLEANNDNDSSADGSDAQQNAKHPVLMRLDSLFRIVKSRPVLCSRDHCPVGHVHVDV